MNIKFDKNGMAQFLYTEKLDLSLLGTVMDIKRVASVEPQGAQWIVKISNKPIILGPFGKRSDAIKAEVEWIEKNLLLLIKREE